MILCRSAIQNQQLNTIIAGPTLKWKINDTLRMQVSRIFGRGWECNRWCVPPAKRAYCWGYGVNMGGCSSYRWEEHVIAGANIIRAKRVSNCYIPPKKYVICACVVCSTNLGFSVEKNCTYIPGISRLPRYVYDTRYVLCTRYVCTWYQPADERSARGRTRLTTVTCISCRSL